MLPLEYGMLQVRWTTKKNRMMRYKNNILSEAATTVDLAPFLYFLQIILHCESRKQAKLKT